MGVFRYQAKNLEGNLIDGKLEANNRSDVVQNLRERRYYPITIEEESTSIMHQDIELFSKVTLKELSNFCRQFAFAIQSGTPILRAIELTMEQCEGNKLKEVLKRAHAQVQRGRPLSEAFKMEDDIPELMVHMIQAGETSGRLDYVMNELSNYYKKMYKQKQKISSATMYPKIVVVFSVIIVTLLLIFIVPQFIENLLSTGGELPLPTKILMGISTFVKKTWMLILAFGILAVGYKLYFLDRDPNYQMMSGKRKISGKLFGNINRQMIAGRFANTFAILSSSGINIISALDISGKVLENKYVESKLMQAKEDIKRGNQIGKTLEDLGVFPIMLTQMITIGEETGTMEEILVKTSEYYDGEVEAATEKLITMIEPILIMGLAAVVLVIILALILPMFNMYDAMSAM